MKIINLTLMALIVFGGCNRKIPSDENSPEIISLTASIQPEVCAVGETVTLKIHLESSGLKKIGEPQTRGMLKGFQVISRSISTQMNYVNGKKSEAIDIMLMLLAREAGDWTVPSYEVKTEDGRVYSTNEIHITVTKSSGEKNNRKKDQLRRRPLPDKNIENNNEAITI